jgi:hypothetical protein
MLIALYFLSPLIYIGIAAVGTAMLPPVDYNEILKSPPAASAPEQK